MSASPLSSWSQTPRRQVDPAGYSSLTSNSPLAIGLGIDPHQIDCVALQPGIVTRNISATPELQPVSPTVTVAYTPPSGSAEQLQNSVEMPVAMPVPHDNLHEADCLQTACTQLEQQLQLSESQRIEDLHQLQEATASLQHKEQQLAQTMEAQAVAQEQQEQLQQVWTATVCLLRP